MVGRLPKADAKGFRFSRVTDDGLGLENFSGDQQLRPRAWDNTPMQVRIEPGKTLVLDAEWVSPPVRVVLSDGQHSLSVQRDAAGLLRVVAHE